MHAHICKRSRSRAQSCGHTEPEDSLGDCFPSPVVTGGCEPADVGAGNQPRSCASAVSHGSSNPARSFCHVRSELELRSSGS